MFTEQERRVYGPYFNGRGMVHGDPLKIHRTLCHYLGGEPNRVVKDFKSDDEGARFEATNLLVEASVVAFDLSRFDPQTGGGCTESEVLEIVKAYLAWCDKKKESSAPTQTGLPASDGQPEALGAPKNAPVGAVVSGPSIEKSLPLPTAYGSRVGLPSI